MNVYLFNPDTDLALASNQENYMASEAVRSMMSDLALLPMWYAEPGSGVLAPSAYNERFLRQMDACFSHGVQLLTPPELAEHPDADIKPWGWNASIRKRLVQLGACSDRLPSMQALGAWRQYASRAHTAELVCRLAREQYGTGRVEVLSSLEACREAVERWKPCVMKSPWSSSGKGLNWCRHGFTAHIEQWCARTLREQGVVLISPIYDKVQDFAMEFYADGRGGIRFVGYSLFDTHASGAYQGNRLMSDEAIEQHLSSYIPLEALHQTRERICINLHNYTKDYQGFLGIDMMICREEGIFKLHPFIELNLRMNMGVLAHTFFERYMHPASEGRFMVEHFPSNENLRAEVARLSEEHPLQIDGGRLMQGFLPLVPVTPQSRNLAYVLKSAPVGN